MGEPPPSPVFRNPGVRRWLRRSVLAVSTVLVLAFGYEAVRVFAGTNQHAVIEGRVYRCSQPSAESLRDLVRSKGIRTVVNLRGTAQNLDRPGSEWYRDEVHTNHELNVSQEDITLSAHRLPPPTELRRLIDVLDHTEYPIVVHCKQGADRTGLTATIVRLLYTDDTLDEARRQLWPIYGHFEVARTQAIDHFFDLYEGWLEQEGLDHSPENFRHWAIAVYTPGPACSKLAWLDPIPEVVPAGKPLGVRVWATNRSGVTWEFKPGNHAGIHLGFVIADETLAIVHRGQAGLLRAAVPPGESIMLTVVVPPLPPGRYALAAEMIDAIGASVPIRSASFVQYGDDKILAGLVVK